MNDAYRALRGSSRPYPGPTTCSQHVLDSLVRSISEYELWNRSWIIYHSMNTHMEHLTSTMNHQFSNMPMAVLNVLPPFTIDSWSPPHLKQLSSVDNILTTAIGIWRFSVAIVKYSLQNVYITMENHHYEWKNARFWLAIFDCYVSHYRRIDIF